jgi:hypothetical protein
MLVFQSLLCAGYAYAHFLTKYATRRGQVFFHATLLLASLFLLPITPSPEWKPDGNAAPILWIITLLLVNVGLPYFLLSATGPLLQAWIARSGIIAQPYRLYALSNVGSLLALVTYPFLIETWLSSGQQAITWSLLFSAFAIVCPLAGLLSLRHRITDNAADNNSSIGLALLPLVPTRFSTLDDATGNNQPSLPRHRRHSISLDRPTLYLFDELHSLL